MLMPLNKCDCAVLKTYIDKFEAHVKPKTNIVFNRYKFQSRIQSESETFDQFVTDLQTLVKECSYDKEDEMVRDRIVFGEKVSEIKSDESTTNDGWTSVWSAYNELGGIRP